MPPFSTRYRKPDDFPKNLKGVGGPLDDSKARAAIDTITERLGRWGKTVVDALTGDLRPHAETHKLGGGDLIRLDELGQPTDNTRLNASTTAHGLLLKLDGNTAHFLRGDGAWATPGGGGGSGSMDDSVLLDLFFEDE